MYSLGAMAGVGAGDFDVIAEDLVVADLERLDPGALALDRFQVGDPLAGVARGFDHVVQLAGIAGADDAGVCSVAGGSSPWRLPAAPALLAQVQAAQIGFSAASLRSTGADGGQRAQRGAHGDQVARQGVPESTRLVRRSRSPSGAARAQLGPQQPFSAGRLHRVPGAGDLGQIQQRLADPLADQALAHRGDGVIQHAQQRAFHSPPRDGFGQLQVAAGGGVQHHELAQE
jgi:hypothetical protein